MNIEPVKQNPQARVHHPYSPSKLQCLEACPNYRSIFTDSPAAAMGTKQHNVADTGEDDQSIPDYRAMAVVECMKFVDERKKLYPGHTMIKEEYLPVDDRVVIAPAPVECLDNPGAVVPPTFPADQFIGTTAGYLDVGILSADQTEAEIIDYKFGAVQVEPAYNNLQGMAYMLGLRRRYPSIKKCKVWFIMPHRDEILGTEFEEIHFPNIYLRILTVVNRSIAANDRALKGDWTMARANVGACLFCACLGKCPKVAELALSVGKKYAPLEIPDSISTVVFKDASQLEKGLRLAQVIKTWAEAYRTQATAKTIRDRNFIPEGYKLVESQQRKVKNAKALCDLAKTFLPPEMHDKVEALYDVPLGAVEELIQLASPRGQKEKTVDKFGESALEAGHLELGTPFAFLRQETKKSKESKQQPQT